MINHHNRRIFAHFIREIEIASANATAVPCHVRKFCGTISYSDDLPGCAIVVFLTPDGRSLASCGVTAKSCTPAMGYNSPRMSGFVRNGPIPWLPSLPDITPRYFFLWGYFKDECNCWCDRNCHTPNSVGHLEGNWIPLGHVTCHDVKGAHIEIGFPFYSIDSKGNYTFLSYFFILCKQFYFVISGLKIIRYRNPDNNLEYY
jgi:hypothetical protein